MAATKTNVEVLDWDQVVAGAPPATPSDINVSTVFRAGLSVTVCPIEAVANALGALVIVEGRFGSNDEDWRALYELRMGAGTANTANVAVEAASAQADLIVDDASNFITPGQKFLVHNTASDIASETVRILSVAINGNDTITLINNLQNTQQTSANVYDIVAEKLFPLPDELSTARVILINDDDDCNVLWRVDVARLTAIS